MSFEALRESEEELYRLASQVGADVDRYAVVFDIDDTVLRRTRDGYTEAIPEMFKLYMTAIRLGFAVFFVSARPVGEDGSNRKPTQLELASVGYKPEKREGGVVVEPGYRDLFLYPQHLYLGDPTAPMFGRSSAIALFKEQARAFIARRHVILLNVGDQAWDHAGQHHFTTIKVNTESRTITVRR